MFLMVWGYEGKVLVNADRLDLIRVKTTGDIDRIYTVVGMMRGQSIKLGTYHSEKRADEVIDGIKTAISHKTPVYEVPYM